MIHQLLIADEAEMHRCQLACAKRASVVVGGIDTRDFSFRVYRGLVQNVEDYPASERLSGTRWRITIQA